MLLYFGCKLDALVRENLLSQDGIYSEVEIRRVAAFRMARYTIISPNPEDDAQGYMRRWAANSGLMTKHPDAKLIGWDFPFVSQEQLNRFGMHGYVAAYVIPEDFQTAFPGVQYTENAEALYAVITITDPFVQPFERIPSAYKKIGDFFRSNGIREKQQDQVISCFEHEYEKDGITYMDVYVHADCPKDSTDSIRL